jgi:transcription-repair coupling factor (superfamily II helicase)
MVQSDFFEYLKGDTLTKNRLFTCKDEKEAESAFDIAQFLGFRPFTLPDIRADFGDDLRAYQQELFELTKSLYNYYNCKDRKKVLISPIRTLLTNLPKKELFSKIELEFAQSINL